MFRSISLLMILSATAAATAAAADEAAPKPCPQNGPAVLTSQADAAAKDAAQIVTVGEITPSGGSYSFSGSTAYFSGPTLSDSSPNFNPPDPKHPETTNGSLKLEAADLSSGAGTLTGTSFNGSSITILVEQAKGPCPWGEGLCAKMSGVINLSAQEVQAAGFKDPGPLLAVGMSLQISGMEVSGGYADLCYTRDSGKNCHGIQLQFIPH